MEVGTLEYVVPSQDNRPPPVPAPDPPSALLRLDEENTNESNSNLILPALPNTSEVSAPSFYNPSEPQDDPFFDDEAGYTPVPLQ